MQAAKDHKVYAGFAAASASLGNAVARFRTRPDPAASLSGPGYDRYGRPGLLT